MITLGGKRLYFAGDTECIPEMRNLKNIDVAFVPMNLPYTMTPAEAAECVKAFKPKIVYPYHYRSSNVDEFAAALKGEAIGVLQGKLVSHPEKRREKLNEKISK
ncbi:MAG: MBL fold metallo-hydrolase [Pyrinomonadaceae bacterium]